MIDHLLMQTKLLTVVTACQQNNYMNLNSDAVTKHSFDNIYTALVRMERVCSCLVFFSMYKQIKKLTV